MTTGPTQNYGDPTLRRWEPRPRLALLIRVIVFALPFAASLAFGLAVSRWIPGHLGLGRWSWLAVDVAAVLAVFWLVGRLARKLLPLSSLLRLALIFPDQAPSRFATAIRAHSTSALRHRVERLQADGALVQGADAYATDLLGLVAALSVHDSLTSGHSERVMAYAAMIADEMDLSEDDAGRIRWAALLHDIGKLQVPAHILNKAGRPSEDEWHVLCTHPAEGVTLAQPLADWLGPWIAGIGQHHEKWDGSGYPLGLAGEDIHLGARIVAVADTFDVITSARSYKKPMPAAQARAELARCSGTQFDPAVVRAFLAIGLGRLRATAGLLSLLTAMPGLRSLATTEPAGRAAAQAGFGLAAAATVAVTAVAAAAVPPQVRAASLDGPVSVRSAAVAASAAARSGTRAPATQPRVPVGSSRPAAGSATRPAGRVVGPPAAGRPADPAARPASTATTSPGARATAHTVARRAGAAPSPVATQRTSGSSASTPVATASPCARARAGASDLAGKDLHGCDLRGKTVTGDYSDTDLSGADLRGATLSHLNLNDATLTGADLRSATIHDVSFDRALLRSARLERATISHVGFPGSDLTGARLSFAHVDNSGFDGAKLRSARLDHAVAGGDSVSMTAADLVAADLSSADFSGADFTGADLTRARLQRIDLSGANLRRAVLVDASGTPASTANATWDDTRCPGGAVRSSSCF